MGGPCTLPPVFPGIGTVVLIACLAVPGLLHADYRITHKETTVLTQCYWIQHGRLHLCEGGEPLVLSEVGAIEEGGRTALEAELHRDTLRRFFISIAWLGDRESEVRENDDILVQNFPELDDLLSQKERKKELKDLRKRLLADVEDTRNRVVGLKEAWEGVRIPERNLMRPVEIKSLQILTWLQSLQEQEIFLETLDPTFRANAREHARQSVQFGTMYMESMLNSGGEPLE